MPKKTGTRKIRSRRPKPPEQSGVFLKDINYKNVEILKKFTSSRHKILPRKITGLSAKMQRQLQVEVKKARIMGLLPFTDRHALS